MYRSRCIVAVMWIAFVETGLSFKRSDSFVETHIGFMGDLYAGHGEFPWVVEIRTMDSENYSRQEEWSIGNLIGPRYVLTTCNAVADFIIEQPIKDRYIVSPKNPYLYKVMYSPDFPYHGPLFYVNAYYYTRGFPRELKSGTRSIFRMSPHPFCEPTTFKNFWGIVEVDGDAIKPFRKFINYAAAELDATQLYRKWYIVKSTSVWRPALLSTWGRDYYDKYSKNTMLHNFKLKFKVKHLEWNDCKKAAPLFGITKWNTNLEQVNQTFCMGIQDPEHTMGAICDHDRGAALVHDDYFIGIVVTGVRYDKCSNLDPQPFIVQSIQDAQVYWTNVQRQILSYFVNNHTHLFPGIRQKIITLDTSTEQPKSDAPSFREATTSLIYYFVLRIVLTFKVHF